MLCVQRRRVFADARPSLLYYVFGALLYYVFGSLRVYYEFGFFVGYYVHVVFFLYYLDSVRSRCNACGLRRVPCRPSREVVADSLL